MPLVSHITRIRIITVCVVFFAFALVVKLFFVQIINGDDYRQEAMRQYSAPVSDVFNRGKILWTSRDGLYSSAATLKTGAIIAINPKFLSDAEGVFKKLSSIIELDEEDFFIKAAKKADPYEIIARRVSNEDASAIESLNLPNVIISLDRWRFYPAGRRASHVLGFVGYSGDEFLGRYGVERFYDELLAKKNKNLYVNFFAEVFFGLSATIFEDKSLRDGDIVLSLEREVEARLEKEISDIMEKWDSSSAGGIIINPKTGEIYAMAALPDFDPNTFNNETNSLIFSNPNVEDVYEMGSIIKPLTMAAALDTGAVTKETEYYDAGYVDLDGAHIENYDGKGRGLVPMQEVLNQSLNTGAVFIMTKMGPDKLRNYFEKFGFGEKTGIDLPNEARGLIKNLTSARTIEYATASFGQGIAMTPIATARALSALGNGGLLPTPYVVSEIDYDLGFSSKTSHQAPRRVISSQTSETITRMLVDVVDNALLGGTVALPNYSIAAKTGTAQIANPDGGGYYDDRNLHSFFGYFPAYDPEFLIFLYTKYPKEIKYASQTLTEPFMNLTKFLIGYYNIPPDR